MVQLYSCVDRGPRRNAGKLEHSTEARTVVLTDFEIFPGRRKRDRGGGLGLLSGYLLFLIVIEEPWRHILQVLDVVR